MLAVACALAAGCRVFLPSRDDKAASFAPLERAAVDGVPLARFLRVRTAVIVTDLRVVTGTGAAGLETSGHGSAVPIAEDGYFLTAAHCVDDEPGHPRHVVLRTGDETRAFPLRLVWVGDRARGEDLALVRADGVRIAPVFAWASASAVAPGAELVSCGYARALAPAVAAGAACEPPAVLPARAPAGPTVTAFVHSVPLTTGDSGGPLVTRAGRLVGINVRAEIVFGPGWRGLALRPDPAWIEARIARDRRESSAGARR